MTNKATDGATLPDDIETLLTNAMLDGRCSQDFALELRDALLEHILRKQSGMVTGNCPDCKGFGIVSNDDGTVEEGCELCAGTGTIRVVPGPPRTVSHATAPVA